MKDRDLKKTNDSSSQSNDAIQQKRQLIEKYILAYNSFDIDGMMSLLHSEIKFKNISDGEVNATATGKNEFRAVAEQSKTVFKSRKQTIEFCDIDEDRASVEISFKGVLATDLPNGMKSGEMINLDGRSEFSFKDGKISQIVDIS